MVFKPFQPPTLKKPPQSQDASVQPAKRRRISGDDGNDAKPVQGMRSFASVASEAIETHRLSRPHLGLRKPLLQVKNLADAGSQVDDESGDGVEGFYNVLW